MGTSQFWHHHDIKLHYYQEGTGPPFFLVHGYSVANTWQVWEHTIPLLTAEHTVYAFDMIGHGESTTMDPKPSVEYQANLLVTMIHELRLSDCSLGGVSWGGTICQLVTSKISEQIKRLLLISSAGYRLPEEVLQPTQNIPTLIVWSEDDGVIPLAKGEQLAQKLPHAQFVIIPTVAGVSAIEAHHPQHNKPELTNPHIRSFLQSTR